MEKIMRSLKVLCLCFTIFLSANFAFGGYWFANELDDQTYQIFSLKSPNELIDRDDLFSFNKNKFASVERLNLSQAVVFDNCNSKEGRCSENKEKIEIWAEANDPENDVLTYHYKISGGEIIGKGEKVVWDLSDVKSGEYTITAGVEDGCGICGYTKTRTVYVIECPEKVEGDITPGFISLLKLNQNNVFAICPVEFDFQEEPCQGKKSFVQIITKAQASKDLNAIYKYEVTDGQIIGNGDDVYWDLSKAKPGNHVITASVDAGRGFCTNSVSDVVRVSKCPSCK